MKAVSGATARHADHGLDRDKDRPTHCGAMALQSDRGYEAAPQMFVRLTGSHLARPSQQPATADA